MVSNARAVPSREVDTKTPTLLGTNWREVILDEWLYCSVFYFNASKRAIHILDDVFHNRMRPDTEPVAIRSDD